MMIMEQNKAPLPTGMNPTMSLLTLLMLNGNNQPLTTLSPLYLVVSFKSLFDSSLTQIALSSLYYSLLLSIIMSALNIGEIYATAIDTTIKPLAGDAPDNLETLVDTVKDRLIASRLLSVDFVPIILRKLYERDGGNNTAAHVDELLASVNASHALDDHAMQAGTGCIASDDQQAQQVQDGARFYLLSLTLTAAQLRYYDHFYADTALMSNFRETIVPAEIPDDQQVHVRYVGCTEAATPQQRHQSDMDANLQMRLGNFLTSCAQVLDMDLDWQVYEVPALFVLAEDEAINQTLVDATEQVFSWIYTLSIWRGKRLIALYNKAVTIIHNLLLYVFDVDSYLVLNNETTLHITDRAML